MDNSANHGDAAGLYPNWMFDGADQDFPMIPITFTQRFFAKVMWFLQM